MALEIYAYKCKKCGQLHYPYRMVCKKCGKNDVFEFDTVPLPKQGKLLTFTTVYNLPPDFNVAKLGLGIVELENGMRITGQLRIPHPKLGMAVTGKVEIVREAEYSKNYGHGVLPCVMLLSIGDQVKPGTYRLHSCFRRAINFEREGRLVSVVDESIGPGPVNIVIRGLRGVAWGTPAQELTDGQPREGNIAKTARWQEDLVVMSGLERQETGSPSPRPSPSGRGGSEARLSTFPAVAASRKRWRLSSLSLRERAGVGGKVPDPVQPHQNGPGEAPVVCLPLEVGRGTVTFARRRYGFTSRQRYDSRLDQVFSRAAEAMDARRQSRGRSARSVWSAWSLLPLSSSPTACDSASKLDALHALWAAGYPSELKRLVRNLQALSTSLKEAAPPKSLAFLLNDERRKHFRGGVERAFTRRIARGVEQVFGGSLLPGIRLLKGCGLGLTPAGDDFIAGFLIGLHGLERLCGQDHRPTIDAVFRAARGSNIFSNTFLDLARQGLVFGRMKDLLQSLVSGTHGSVRKAAKALFAIGETSGADLATGLLLTLRGFPQSGKQATPGKAALGRIADSQ